MSGAQPILFERRGRLAVVTLNRPAALNALTLDMIRQLDRKLADWAVDPSVGAVVIRGAGERAFCAGGDVRALYDGDAAYRAAFYRDEYRLDRRVFRFPKPYVALIDGVVMGGGVGVSVHGSHRVASERTLFAMPETGIGLFPDVGGGYFLPRRPGRIGMYLALTGARLGAADCLYAGIATHHVPGDRLDALVDALADGDVDATLVRFATDPGPPPLAERRAAIDRCFAGGSVETIIATLEAESGDWARTARATLAAKSPTSLKLTFRQLSAGATLDFEAVLVMEYRLSQFCMAGHDFFEGVRAVVIDKDNAPRWRPATLAEVTDAEIDRAFRPLGDSDLNFD
ncbi:MAG: enoyl-CoA hydratase/isomerase family protein [Dongiaceae bacterium]